MHLNRNDVEFRRKTFLYSRPPQHAICCFEEGKFFTALVTYKCENPGTHKKFLSLLLVVKKLVLVFAYSESMHRGLENAFNDYCHSASLSYIQIPSDISLMPYTEMCAQF